MVKKMCKVFNCRPVSRGRVEKVWRGEWVYDKDGYLICSRCGFHPTYSQNSKDKKGLSNCQFCPNCGDAKTDEALEMVIERSEALNENIE